MRVAGHCVISLPVAVGVAGAVCIQHIALQCFFVFDVNVCNSSMQGCAGFEYQGQRKG